MYNIVRLEELKPGDEIIIIGLDGYPKLEKVEKYDEESGLIILVNGLDVSWDSSEIAVAASEPKLKF